ncbi:MAG: gliding motility-associated C-terminal domain-containing protein [Bacteroidetes bacterium]|nr:gliding motility-associated C-terminal domain-containing protein [Bacteroidota bacterium]
MMKFKNYLFALNQKTVYVLLFLLFAIHYLSAQLPNPLDFNTATNTTNTGVLAQGSNDLHWTVSTTGINGTYVPAIVWGNGTWGGSNYPNATWITSPGACTGNDLYFKLTITLPGVVCGQPTVNPGAYCLYLDYYADDYLKEIFINGISSFTNSTCCNYSPGSGLSVNLCNNWVTGANTLIVHVDASTGCPTGLFVQASTSGTSTTMPSVSATASSFTICEGSTVTLSANGASNYSWTPTNSLNTPTDSVTIATPTVSTTYYVITTNSYSCKDTDTVAIVVHPMPIANFSSAAPYCVNSAVTFTNTTNVNGATISSWQWDVNSDGLVDYNTPNCSNTFTSSGAKLVSFTVTSDKGCRSVDTTTLFVNPLPFFDFTTSTTTGCVPLCANLSNTSIAAVSYFWEVSNGSSSAISSPQLCFNTSGIIDMSLTVTDANGCSDMIVKNSFIQVNPSPNADFNFSTSTTTILNPIIDIKDNSTGATTWLYDFGDGLQSTENSPTHIYDVMDTTTFSITQIVSNSVGCSDTITKTLHIGQGFAFYIPNAFTPNGDLSDDIFTPQGIGISNYELLIYNRWGVLVFESNALNTGWDGDKAPQDVYVYKIKCADVFGKSYLYVGAVTLIR